MAIIREVQFGIMRVSGSSTDRFSKSFVLFLKCSFDVIFPLCDWVLMHEVFFFTFTNVACCVQLVVSK